MICPLLVVALIQSRFFDPDGMPENFLRSPAALCVGNQCAFYNRVSGDCGQSQPQASILGFTLPAIKEDVRQISESVALLVEKSDYS